MIVLYSRCKKVVQSVVNYRRLPNGSFHFVAILVVVFKFDSELLKVKHAIIILLKRNINSLLLLHFIVQSSHH